MNVRTTRLPTIIIAAVLTGLISGGGVYAWQHAKVQLLTATARSLQYDLDRRQLYRTITPQESARFTEMEQRAADLEEEVGLLRGFPADAAVPPGLLAVYGALDGNDLRHIVISYCVPVNRNQPVIEKMRILADRISRFSFDSLPITVTGINTFKGRSVATIDLRETGWKNGPSWFGGVFEGSSGGAITQETLVRSFLQKGYTGQWVDGIRFTYEGKPDPAGDHVDLSGVFYR